VKKRKETDMTKRMNDGLEEKSLLKMAAKTHRLACQADPDYGPHQKARIERAMARFFRCVRWAIREGKPIPEQPHPGGWKTFLLIHIAIRMGLDELWDFLWDEKHPDLCGQAWDGEDFDLMKDWREKAIGMIKDCHQEAVLDMTADVFIEKLMEAGATQEHARHLAEGLLEVVQGEE
jgi:hypothetical protein